MTYLLVEAVTCARRVAPFEPAEPRPELPGG